MCVYDLRKRDYHYAYLTQIFSSQVGYQNFRVSLTHIYAMLTTNWYGLSIYIVYKYIWKENVVIWARLQFSGTNGPGLLLWICIPFEFCDILWCRWKKNSFVCTILSWLEASDHFIHCQNMVLICAMIWTWNILHPQRRSESPYNCSLPHVGHYQYSGHHRNHQHLYIHSMSSSMLGQRHRLQKLNKFLYQLQRVMLKLW